MAVFEAKDHNQPNKQGKNNVLAAKARTFYNIISEWWVEHFTLTLQNILSELMRQDGRN